MWGKGAVHHIRKIAMSHREAEREREREREKERERER